MYVSVNLAVIGADNERSVTCSKRFSESMLADN